MTRFALFVGSLLVMLVGGSTPARAQRSVDVDNSEALLRVMVSDRKGRKISGLQQDNFTVRIDGAPAKIVRFRDQKEPASIGIVLDVSGSTDTRWSDASRSLVRFGKGLDHFQRLSNKANEFFVIGFNDQPALLLDWTSEQKPISNIFPSVRAQGQTALFDACYIAVDKVNRARHRKRVIVIFSDGQDNRSRYTFRELRDFVWQSDVLIYSINPIFLTESSLAKEAQSILDELSVTTGGMTFSTIRDSGFSS